jgi:peptide deformylase
MCSNVLILGNPILREKSVSISDFKDNDNIVDFRRLKTELEDFRKKNGFGRGIAGIQIGVKKRIIALNFGEGPFVIINPEIISRSTELFTMWDDCMSFPELMVRVERNKSIGLKYQDENGCTKEWKNIEQDKSELLQHEIDHLDGIMAIDKAINKTDIIYKNEFNKNRKKYDRMVEYGISSTIK